MNRKNEGDPICKVCGEVMEAYCEDFWVCDCGNKAFITFGDTTKTIIQECDCDPGEIMHTEEKPLQCQNCDSDMYPLCIDGCPAIDD